MMDVFYLYLLFVNVVTFFLYGADKWKAKKGKRRIPEKTLIGTAVAFGSVGALAGMYTFRHKTRKVKFYLGVPVILTLQVTIMVCVYYYL